MSRKRPPCAIEERPGFAGARRALGGLGGHIGAPHVGRIAHAIIAAVRSRSRTKSWVFVVLLLVLAVVGSVSYLGWRQSVPGVRAVVKAPRAIGHKSTIPLTLEAPRGQVARVEIRVLQDGKSAIALTQDGKLGSRVDVPLTIDSAALGLREGAATVEVWGRDDFWRPLRQRDRVVASIPLTVDLTPPRIEIVASTQYLAPGGVGVVVFRVSDSARADVSVGSVPFPSFGAGGQDRVALVALPYNYTTGTPIKISAQDEAGNVASRGVAAEILPRRFRTTASRSETRPSAQSAELVPKRRPRSRSSTASSSSIVICAVRPKRPSASSPRRPPTSRCGRARSSSLATPRSSPTSPRPARTSMAGVRSTPRFTSASTSPPPSTRRCPRPTRERRLRRPATIYATVS